MIFNFIVAVICFYALIPSANGCSNIIVSPGASADSSSMIAYNADSGSLYGLLYHYPAGNHPSGSMRDIYDWDSGVYLGKIEEVPHTYNVVGNVNEYGVMIGETTFGGINSLQEQDGAIIDYGSLIYVTLQRSKTAREAIHTISDLMAKYGYASEGESFSIADQNEAWIMEIIGKGNYELGAVWVAVKVPDGYITAHANQARIQTFSLNDPENCLYSKDVISFAKKIGLYPADATDEAFSFSDIYDPVDFSGARICEARVWSVFSSVMGSDWSNQYLDYAEGLNFTNRMPLFVKPNNKLTLLDTMEYMRSHYENSALDMQGLQFSDVGAYTTSIYRAHPLTWTSTVAPDGSTASQPIQYFHERPIATPQTGWNFVAQSRKWMPREFAALLWFGVDDSGTTVRFPIYGSATQVPKTFGGKGPQDGVVPPMMDFNLDSAFYVFNLVANWAYSRWDLMYPEVYNAIVDKEKQYMVEMERLDQEVTSIAQKDGMKAAVDHATKYAVQTGDQLTKDWFAFFGKLFVKYRDGYVVTENKNSKACGCNAAGAGYPQPWFDRIVRDTQAHYEWDPNGTSQKKQIKSKDPALLPMDKLKLRALQ